MRFLHSPHSRLLTGLLLAHIVFFYGFSRTETPPSRQQLSGLPAAIGGWRLARSVDVDKDVREILKADDLLSRVYVNPELRQQASLFIAYFRSQRTGAAPHSPRNCLPGAGWMPSRSGTASLRVAGRAEPITVNQYVVSKGPDEESVVLYWYQSHGRVIASEYAAKVYLVSDAIRLNRTDTALVRIVVPVANRDQQAAQLAAGQFARDTFPALTPFLPN